MTKVHGIIRRSSSFNTGRIDHIYKDRHTTGRKLFLHYGDLCDATNLISVIATVRPTEIYNLGAMSHVKVSFDMPEYTAECDAVGVLRMLDAIRACGLEKTVKFYQASTSELYGKVQETPQKETTPFYPRSPYAGKYIHTLKTHALNITWWKLQFLRIFCPLSLSFSCQAIRLLDSCELP